MKARFLSLAALVLALAPEHHAGALTIEIDYQYDENGFFSAEERRAVLRAAADRFSSIITTVLKEAHVPGVSGGRIGFPHPATGNLYEVSAAPDADSDPLVALNAPVANEYRNGMTFEEDVWILYAGGRPMGSGAQAGVGGAATGRNFTTVFGDPDSHMNRGFNLSPSTSEPLSLPVWGGSISFNSDTVWHFGLDAPAPQGAVDFYTVALHEIGHALGLSVGWSNWSDHVDGGLFTGPNAVAAYNADNGTNLTGLAITGGDPVNNHWSDNAYESYIFELGNPNYAGTAGAGALQPLLMESVADFTSEIRRFELTNVDVAALADIGWTVVPEPGASLLAAATGAVALARRRRAGTVTV